MWNLVLPWERPQRLHYLLLWGNEKWMSFAVWKPLSRYECSLVCGYSSIQFSISRKVEAVQDQASRKFWMLVNDGHVTLLSPFFKARNWVVWVVSENGASYIPLKLTMHSKNTGHALHDNQEGYFIEGSCSCFGVVDVYIPALEQFLLVGSTKALPFLQANFLETGCVGLRNILWFTLKIWTLNKEAFYVLLGCSR